MDLNPLLQQENALLKRVKLEQRGSSLHLRGTFPDRADPGQTKRMRLSLGLAANAANLDRAAEWAHKVDRWLRSGRFYWESVDSLIGRLDHSWTTQAFAEKLEEVFEQLNPGVPKTSATAWGKRYKPTIKALLRYRGPCTTEGLIKALQLIESPSARRTAGSVVNQGARQLRIDVDTKAIAESTRGYTARAVNPRQIPSDELIESLIDQIKLPHWRWMYGMLWLFGIRPHEITGAKLIERDGSWVLRVVDDTKTGAREAWAAPNAMIKRYKLDQVCRPPQDKYNVAKSCSDYLVSSGSNGRGGRRKPIIPFPLYNLRHAYAIRLLEAGMPSEVGARLMGHSVELHNSTYKRWIDQNHMQTLHQRFSGKLA